MAGKEIDLGPTADIVRANIARLRRGRGLTYADLSRELEEAGRRIPPLGLRRIEAGERRIDIDDFVALARALWVDPATLLLPPVVNVDTVVPFTGVGSFWAIQAVAWVRGLPPEVLAWQQSLRHPDDWQGERDAEGRPVYNEKSEFWRTYSPRIDPEVERRIAGDEQAADDA